MRRAGGVPRDKRIKEDGPRRAVSYLPIHLLSLDPQDAPEFAVYLAGNPSAPKLCDGPGVPLPEDTRRRLMDRGVTHVYIEQAEQRAYLHYLERRLEGILHDPEIDLRVKSELLYDAAAGMMHEVLADPTADAAVSRCGELVKSTCRYLLEERKAFGHLLGVTSYDYHVYTHSFHVFVYSVALAQRLGITDPEELQRFGQGALLHDLGKTRIDEKVMNWPGVLNAAQREEMRRHPGLGCDLLREMGVRDEDTLGVVRHHHERLAGGGYPDGLARDKIPEYARICAVADTFDALTTRRAYKSALSTYAALDLMCRDMADGLDRGYLRAFVEMMGVQ